VPQGGRFASEVLGLDLTIEGAGLRFYQTTAPLLGSEEHIVRVESAFNDALRRAADAEERVAELERELEEKGAAVRALREELARLKGEGGGKG
jgi:chromosome segregation ATPase